uniref:C2H2-type domain-containing protein n=1 Tax=Callorhinchus milii TaxID=7868 RepID=A0A4W3GUP1_CALMI
MLGYWDVGLYGYWDIVLLGYWVISLFRADREAERQRQHKCEVCGKGFSQSCKLTAHRSVHTGNKPFACDTCGRSYNRLDNLRRHQRSHVSHAPGGKGFTCAICGQTFPRASKLSQHQCLLPGGDQTPGSEGFGDLSALRSHGLSHLAAFRCEACGENFLDLRSLQAHRRQRRHTHAHAQRATHTHTHTDKPKPFVCSVCGKGFGKAASLRAHQAIHTGQKSFHCDHCPRTYNRLDNLRRHQRADPHLGAELPVPGLSGNFPGFGVTDRTRVEPRCVRHQDRAAPLLASPQAPGAPRVRDPLQVSRLRRHLSQFLVAGEPSADPQLGTSLQVRRVRRPV